MTGGSVGRAVEPTVCMAVRLPLSLARRVDDAAAARYSNRSVTVRQLVLAGLEAQRTADQKKTP